MFALPLGIAVTVMLFAVPYAWLNCMHSLFLGDTDAGKTWLIINILLHKYSPFLAYYEKVVIISDKCADLNGEWHALVKRCASDKVLLYEKLDKNIFLGMARRKNKSRHWLVIVDDKIKEMKAFDKMVNLYTCRHNDKDSPCCHVWLLIQHYTLVPLGMRKQFKYLFILQCFADNRKMLKNMIDDGVVPGSWSLDQVLALGAAATGKPGNNQFSIAAAIYIFICSVCR